MNLLFFMPANPRINDDDDDDFKAGRNCTIQRVERTAGCCTPSHVVNPFLPRVHSIHHFTSSRSFGSTHLCRVRRFLLLPRTTRLLLLFLLLLQMMSDGLDGHTGYAKGAVPSKLIFSCYF